MVTITLCMIMKDEEAVLSRCLESVRGLVSEVVIHDTGSRDRSIEIAEEFGAKVIRGKWENDFSKARNIALSHATGDWILVLDADEEIRREDHDALRALTTDPHACYFLTQRHYTNDLRLNRSFLCAGLYPQMERGYQGYFDSDLVRFFPRARGLEFRGLVHELIEHSIKDNPELVAKHSGILIHHYGFTPEALARRDKSDLYTNLALAKVKREPSNWQAFYELGIEHNARGRPLEAIDAFKEAVRLSPDQLWVWSNLAHLLGAVGRNEEAVVAFNNALRLDGNCKEVLSNCGLFYYRLKALPEAEKLLRRSVEVDPDFFTGWCNLALVVNRAGRPAHAALLYKRALQINPISVTARSALASLYIDAGQFQLAHDYVESVKDVPDPHHHLALLYYGLALKGLGRTEDSATTLQALLSESGVSTDVRALAHDQLMAIAN